MKKISAVLLAALLCGGFNAFSKDIAPSELPESILAFVKTHFKGYEIRSAEKESDEYEINLSGGECIDFKKDGEWTEIDCKKKCVPAQFIPAEIKKINKEQYKNYYITKIEKEQNSWEIKLNNGLELKLDKDFNIIKAEADD